METFFQAEDVGSIKLLYLKKDDSTSSATIKDMLYIPKVSEFVF